MLTATKYLGVQLDDKLQWDRNIEHVTAKALRALGLIKHTKKFLLSGDLLSHISVIAALGLGLL